MDISFRRLFATVLLMAGVAGICAMLLLPLTPSFAKAPTNLEVLSGAANAYAATNATALFAESDVRQGSFTVPHGYAYGQSFHPSSDGLRALAHLSPQAVGGDVQISFDPVRCNKSAAGPCALVVRSTLDGEALTKTWPIRYETQGPGKVEALPVACSLQAGDRGASQGCRQSQAFHWELVARAVTNKRSDSQTPAITAAPSSPTPAK